MSIFRLERKATRARRAVRAASNSVAYKNGDDIRSHMVNYNDVEGSDAPEKSVAVAVITS